MNPHQPTTRRYSLRHASRASFFAFILYVLACNAYAQTFSSDSRAVRFVTEIVLNDFHTAQAGGGYVFSYDGHETDDTLVAKLQRWFSGKAPQAIGMEPPEKQMLFGFYWAATMMSANSPCFAVMANDGCQDELSKWLALEMSDDPRFVRAYRAASALLGLPPLDRTGH